MPTRLLRWMRSKETEITALLALLAALFVAAGAGLGVWWFGRVA